MKLLNKASRKSSFKPDSAIFSLWLNVLHHIAETFDMTFVISIIRKETSFAGSAFSALSLLVICILFSSCSSSQFNILSTPEGAEVTSLRGDVLGKTPLVLDEAQKRKIEEEGIINFKISSAGYLPRLVMIDASSTREITINLPKSDSESFKSEYSRDFATDINKMLRDAFAVQRLVAEKKNAEARTSLNKFRSEFPSAAFGYFMSAHLALLEGKRSEARSQLLRAQALDPKDSAITQGLQLLGGPAQRGVNAQ